MDQTVRNARAKALAGALAAWVKAQSQFANRVALGKALNIDENQWAKISSGNALFGPKFTESYARIHIVTGLAEADPRTLPPMTYRLKGKDHQTPQAWTEEEYQGWLKQEGRIYQSFGSAADVSSTPKAVSKPRRDRSAQVAPELPRSAFVNDKGVFAGVTTLGGIVDALMGLGLRPVVASVTEELASHISAAVNTLKPGLIEALLPQVVEAVSGLINNQRGDLQRLLSESLSSERAPAPRSVIARTSVNSDSPTRQLLKELQRVLKGTREDRDRFMLADREALAEVYQALAIMTQNSDERERNLPFATREVRVG